MANTPTVEQQNIIENTEGYIRCGAVPGSGKTFCITNRMAYLITELFVDPASIVALTFTNKAAASMTHRLKQMIGDEATCFTGTFHGYCNKILKEEIHRLSYPKTFTILDKKDQIDLIREVAEEQKISLKDNTAKNYLEHISQQKAQGDYVELTIGTERGPLAELLEKSVQAEKQDDKAVIYYAYLLKQRDNFALDFNDIIEYTLYIFENFPDALETWQEKCMYLLCDEYQDVNHKQERLLLYLSGKYHNLTVVGDDDQCIYGWRGSKVEYILDFPNRYHGAKDFYLTENFRSTPQIVEAANSLIEKNQSRLSKRMMTNNPAGNNPIYCLLDTEKEEANWIAERVQAAVEEGKKYNDHTILVRASSQTRAIEESFIKKKIPYKILSGAEFYSSEEIKTVLSYLRMVYALSDLDFSYTIQRPRRGYGKKSVENLKLYAAEQGLTLMEALGKQIEEGTEKRQALIDYYNNIMELHRTHPNYAAADLVNMVLDFGYRKTLQEDVEQTRLDNVSELIATIVGLEDENQERIPLSDLLAHFALFSTQDDDTEKNVVKVMTIHTAKGLEFDTVFINGLVDGQFPSKRLTNQDQLEEERRLFYVAMTRAKNRLYLTGYEEKMAGYPVRQSSFLSDIDSKYLNCVNESRIQKGYRTPTATPKAQLEIGDRIEHKVFGIGEITGIDEKALNYIIKFEKIDLPRRIQFRAELKKL